MSWIDRLQEAAFTSPSGTRTVFKFENVSVTVNKRDKIREFPDYDGALVQNLGIGASSYPLLCIFWGADHDREADAFLVLLSEPGVGMLEHPFYGRLENIVAFGTITRRDDLKTAANQSIFQVNFVQSAAFQFPGSLTEVSDQIISDLGSFAESQSEAYGAGIKIATAKERISLIDTVKAKLNAVKQFLAGIAATVEEIESEFNNAYDAINNNINTLVGQPLTLARNIIDLVNLPARAAARIDATLSAYRNLLDSVISDADGLFTQSFNNIVNNQFLTSELYANAAFAGALTASQKTAEETREVTSQSLENFISPDTEVPAFITKSEIISTINFLSETWDILTAWNDDNRRSLDLLDTGEAYAYLNSSNSLLLGFLVLISFSARQERQIVLSSPRHFIELCGELYGIVDNALDFFILTNDLSGDEINELPAGKTIKYYV